MTARHGRLSVVIAAKVLLMSSPQRVVKPDELSDGAGKALHAVRVRRSTL
jgi:hypothetical protein